MAETTRQLTEYGDKHRSTKTYYNTTALDSDDATSLLDLSNYADRTVHVYGTFGSGGSVTIQGSNKPDEDGTTMVTLHKTDLSALTFTSAGCYTILENPMWIRAKVTAGDGTTALIVSFHGSTSRN